MRADGSSRLDLDEQIGWFSRGTPGHLLGMVGKDCPELGLGDGGHGELIAIGYRLRCKCDCQTFMVTAFRWQRDPNTPEVLLSPVRATCSDCGCQILVFDSDQHGYGPVACNVTSLAHGERQESAVEEFIASKANPATIDIVVYYPDDLFDDDFEQFAGRRHDLFTWLKIVVGENTDPDYPLLSFECA